MRIWSLSGARTAKALIGIDRDKTSALWRLAQGRVLTVCVNGNSEGVSRVVDAVLH